MLCYFNTMSDKSNITTKKTRAGKPPSQRKLNQTLKTLKVAMQGTLPDEEEGVSKSALKRQSTAFQALGERLVELPSERLAQLPMDESLRDAIEAAASISNHEGRRRQIQYVGKLMRFANVDLIAAELDQQSSKNRAEIGIEHAAERWRTRLLEDDATLAVWHDSYPEAPIKKAVIELLKVPASRDTVDGRKRFRDLFRFIKKTLSEKAASATSNAVDE
jgi:ribosome-associated protein